MSCRQITTSGLPCGRRIPASTPEATLCTFHLRMLAQALGVHYLDLSPEHLASASLLPDYISCPGPHNMSVRRLGGVHMITDFSTEREALLIGNYIRNNGMCAQCVGKYSITAAALEDILSDPALPPSRKRGSKG